MRGGQEKKKGKPLDVQDAMERLALDVIISMEKKTL